MDRTSPAKTTRPPFGLTGVELRAPVEPGLDGVLTGAALAFVADLERRFRARRETLLALREARWQRLVDGEAPAFLAETVSVRAAEWRIAPVPADLVDRRVEITGPADRKMIINALNSGASVFMADFEDSLAPTWANVAHGQRHLIDAVRGTIEHVDASSGRTYRLAERVATLMVRPRGWHLDERHVLVDGRPVSASLFDFGLFLFHNAQALLAKGSGPYFYLPKLESHHEARLWNDVFVAAQDLLGLPHGTIKATVLVETILAAFEMDEILYELRLHSAGLNCGRWDYVFSYIKKLGHDRRRLLPDRAAVTMDQHFLRSYRDLLIQTCHRRGAHAIGGMAAWIPVKDDAVKNATALQKVRDDKRREAAAGHDGTWVAHPGLVGVARAEFDAVLKGPHQLDRRRDDVAVTAEDLLRPPDGPRTAAGLAANLRVSLHYLAAWLGGLGCVPIDNLMEDAATAEIARAQVWQLLHHQTELDGERLTRGRVERGLESACEALLAERPDDVQWAARLRSAAAILRDLVFAERCADFLTLRAYPHIVSLPA